MDELIMNDELDEEPEEEQGEIVLATITEITTDGVKIILDGDEEAGEKEYKVNAAQRFITGDRVKVEKNSGTYIVEYVVGKPGNRYPIPSGGSDGQVLTKDGSNPYAVKWTTAHGVPAGGSADYVLAKNSGTDYDLKWMELHGIPSGGTTGQVLAKTSATSYAVGWVASSGLPTGGSAGQVLTKVNATNYNVEWSTIHGIPSGGTAGQVLAKTNATNYNVEWATPSAGLLKNGSYTLTLNSSGVLVPNSSGSISLGSSYYPIGNLYASNSVQLCGSGYSAALGFFGTTPIRKITSITTSSTLANLITALKNYGLF